MDAPADWPFENPPNVAVITSQSITSGDGWIAFVSHDEDDGGWQFHPSEPIQVDDAAVVSLRSVLAKDSSIAELADLPLGWQAWRDGPDAQWERSPHRD